MIELIPAIDIIDGKCVRLTRGDYARKSVYSDDPVAVARRFEATGFKRLHVVDLDGAKSRHIVNSELLRRLAAETSLSIDFGGGIKSDDDVAKAFDCGAEMVTVGSVAVTDPELFGRWLQQYGSRRIILGADVRDGRISINGWKEDSAEGLLPFLKRYVDCGVSQVLCTEISKDGTLAGPALSLYRTVMNACPSLRLIASGGVGSIDDIQALAQAGIPAVVFGKAIYEGRIDLEELMKTMQNKIG